MYKNAITILIKTEKEKKLDGKLSTLIEYYAHQHPFGCNLNRTIEDIKQAVRESDRAE